MMIIFDILIGISVLLFIGEVVAQKLPEGNSFVKWWRTHIIGKLPDDDPHF
jgi:pSer/pThr/pTyr-binding forkhead associated (FHA) protein